MDKIFKTLFNNTSFNIIFCEKKLVGSNWGSSEKKPFKDLNHHRLYYVIDGGAQITTKKGECIALEKGNVYFIRANTIQSTFCEDFLHHYYLHFTTGSPSLDFLDFYDSFTMIPANGNTLNYFETIEKSLREKTYDGVFLAQGYLNIILAKFFANTKFKNKNIIKFFDVLNYIDQNIEKEITINELAELMHLDPTYFGNLFSQTFEISPKQYILRKKISKAQMLLLDDSIPINDIALRCGFEDQLYFSRIFKKKTGLSPINYRKDMLKYSRESE